MHFCRTCESEIEDVIFEVHNCKNGIVRTMLEVCIPEINCDLTRNPIVCNSCLTDVSNMYQFKTKCISNENRISRTKLFNFKIDLAAFMDDGAALIVPGDKICRFCIKKANECYPVDKNVESLKDGFVKDSLALYIPEIDIALTEDPLICIDCLNILLVFAAFHTMCLETEAKVVAQYGSGLIDKPDLASKFNKQSRSNIKLKSYKNNNIIKGTDKSAIDSTDKVLADVSWSNQHFGIVSVSSGSDHGETISNGVENLSNGLDSKEEQEECMIIDDKTDPLEVTKTKSDQITLQNIINQSVASSFDSSNGISINNNKGDIDVDHILISDDEDVPVGNDPTPDEVKSNSNSVKDVNKKNDIDFGNLSCTEYSCESSDGEDSNQSNKIPRPKITVFQGKYGRKMFQCRGCLHTQLEKALIFPHSCAFEKERSKHFDLWKCNKCSFSTYRKSLHLKHRTFHSSDTYTGFKCDICGYRTGQRNNFKTHCEKLHNSSIPLFKCNDCAFTSEYKPIMSHHKLRHKKIPGVRKFKCSRCDFSTNYQMSFTVHMKKHKVPSFKGSKILHCKFCSYYSNAQDCYDQHVLTHKERESN